DVTLRENTQRLYAIVTTRSTASRDRAYTARITMTRGTGVPAENTQLVVLVFDGASGVRIANRNAVDVPPFDAVKISARYAGRTAEIVQNVITMVRQSYDGLNVQIYASGDPALPDADHSSVYFG